MTVGPAEANEASLSSVKAVTAATMTIPAMTLTMVPLPQSRSRPLRFGNQCSPSEQLRWRNYRATPHRREGGKVQTRFSFPRIKGADTRNLVKGPDGCSSFWAPVRCSNRFHFRCNSRCRSRGYWREFGTSNLPSYVIQNRGSHGLFHRTRRQMPRSSGAQSRRPKSLGRQ
jgi:hypothetical protein